MSQTIPHSWAALAEAAALQEDATQRSDLATAADGWLRLAEGQLSRGNVTGCQELLVKARADAGTVQERRSLADCFAVLAAHQARQGFVPAARLNLERALRLNPANELARKQLVQLLLDTAESVDAAQ